MKIKNFEQFINGVPKVNELSTDLMTRAEDARSKQGMSSEELAKKYAVSMNNELYKLNKEIPNVLRAAGFYDKCIDLTDRLRQLIKAGDHIEYQNSRGKYSGKLLNTLQYGGPWVDGSIISFGALQVYHQYSKQMVDLRAEAVNHPLVDCKIFVDADKVTAIKKIVDEFEDLSKWLTDVTPKIVKFAKGEGHQVLTAELAETLPKINNFMGGEHKLSSRILPLVEQTDSIKAAA